MQAQTAVAKALQHKAIKDKENPSDWRVEALDSKAGDVYVAIFSGPLAEQRAIEYAKFKNGSAI
jgi:hypothetical protein